MRTGVRWISVLFSVVIANALFGCDAGAPDHTPPPSAAPPDNGVAALPAAEIYEKAKAALAGAENVRLDGSSMAGGSVIAFDIRIAGADYAGMIEQDGDRTDYLKLGSDLWVKASDEFWTQMVKPAQRAAAASFSGKYVHLDLRDSRFAERAASLGIDVDELFEEILASHGVLTKGETTVVDRTPAISLVAGEREATIFVSTVAKPLPLRVDSEFDQGTTTFRYEAFELAKPPVDVVEFLPEMLVQN